MAAVAARVAIQGTVGSLKDDWGEEVYEDRRTSATWINAAASAFLPINPTLYVFQLGFFVLFSILFIFYFGFSKESFLGAYVAQGIVVMIGYHFVLDKVLRYVGV